MGADLYERDGFAPVLFGVAVLSWPLMMFEVECRRYG